MPLTDEQKASIRETAGEIVYADVVENQNWDYFGSILDDWLNAMEPIEQAYRVSSDPRLWPEFWEFDPATGKQYPLDEDGNPLGLED